MSSVRLSSSSLAELQALVGDTLAKGQTVDWFVRQIRDRGEPLGWQDAFEYRVPKRRYHRAGALIRSYSTIAYAENREMQLAEGNYERWVYHSDGGHNEACPAEHRALDGVAVPRDHPFWRVWFPPNGFLCRCSVSGARSDAGVRRMGGDPAKPLPHWWSDPARGPHPDFVGFARPSFEEIVEWALNSPDL